MSYRVELVIHYTTSSKNSSLLISILKQCLGSEIKLAIFRTNEMSSKIRLAVCHTLIKAGTQESQVSM